MVMSFRNCQTWMRTVEEVDSTEIIVFSLPCSVRLLSKDRALISNRRNGSLCIRWSRKTQLYEQTWKYSKKRPFIIHVPTSGCLSLWSCCFTAWIPTWFRNLHYLTKDLQRKAAGVPKPLSHQCRRDINAAVINLTKTAITINVWRLYLFGKLLL